MSEETRAIAEKFSLFCDEILYPQERFVVIEHICDKRRQESFGDKCIEIEGRKLFIDEKSASYLHPNMVIEIIQDAKQTPPDLGWFYKLIHAHLLIYGYYENENPTPSIIYKVDWQKCRQYILRELGSDKKISCGYTNKNYGTTINLYPRWQELIQANIAKIIFSNSEQKEKTQKEMDFTEPCSQVEVEEMFRKLKAAVSA